MSKEPLIAIIDDDASFRASLVDLLSSIAYRAEAFACAEDFIAATTNPYDCVVSDVHMPGMSGIDLQQLLASRAYPVPVIMVTGRTEPGLEQRVVSSGAVCLLKKPFDADVLIDCLERVLKP